MTVIGGEISAYNVILATYALCALLVTCWEARRVNIATTDVAGAFAVVLPAAILGARALDIAEYSTAYASWTEALGRQGSSIYGAFIACAVVVPAYAWWRGVGILRLFDAGAPAAALGEAMTRIGCFLNGCCYGIPWRGALAVTFSHGTVAHAEHAARGLISWEAPSSLPVHPVQLYSAACAMALMAWLIRINERRPLIVGRATFTFLVGYGILRLVMGMLRAEALRSMKAFSALFIVVGLVGLTTLRRVGRTQSCSVPL